MRMPIKREGKYMKHYTEQELDKKIHAFLDAKTEKYPEIAKAPKSESIVTMPALVAKYFELFPWARPVTY